MERAMHLVVSGRVQGVGFRYFVVRAAVDCGVVGWVRNLGNGDVEVWAEGSARALDRLTEVVRRGPRHAEVDGVERTDGEATGAHERFEVRFEDES